MTLSVILGKCNYQHAFDVVAGCICCGESAIADSVDDAFAVVYYQN